MESEVRRCLQMTQAVPGVEIDLLWDPGGKAQQGMAETLTSTGESLEVCCSVGNSPLCYLSLQCGVRLDGL